MKTTTRKLSGPSKDRFFRRFFAEEKGLSDDLAERLASRSSGVFSSVRIRRDVFGLTRNAPPRPLPGTSAPKKTLLQHEPEDLAVLKGERVVPARITRPQPAPSTQTESTPKPTPPAPELVPSTPEPAPPLEARAPAPEGTAPIAPTEPFDPYAIGLVPTFQREGRRGLADKLAAIASVNDLRAMAKAQQIVLPRELRTGDAKPETIREAIATAVARRVDDRRSAAG